MTGYSFDEIKKDVRTILDRNQAITEQPLLVSDIDTLSLDDIIEGVILPAARQVELIAPEEFVDWIDAAESVTPIVSPADNMVTLSLPDEFLRFKSCKLSKWKLPVDSYVTPSDKEYKRQWYGVPGLQASDIKPLAALVESKSSSNVKLTMQMFGGVVMGTKVDYCLVAVEPTIESSTLMIGDQLKIPFSYCCASLVADALKDTERSNALMQICKNLMTVAPDIDVNAIANEQ